MYLEPIVDITLPDGTRTYYGNVDSIEIENILNFHLSKNKPLLDRVFAGNDKAAKLWDIQNINDISIFIGTHNEQSCILATTLMEENQIQRNDERIHFSQLLGMSNHITYNLAKEGYNTSKYIPFFLSLKNFKIERSSPH